MFHHSVKVPRLYKTASKIAQQVAEGKGSVKQLVYEGKHPNIKALYSLIVETLQRTHQIEDLLKKSKLFEKEPRFDIWLAKILMTELLWGKKHLSGNSKPIQTILGYEQIFKAHLSDNLEEDNSKQVIKPRYVRVNTILISVNEAIDEFEADGWKLNTYPHTISYREFLGKASTLEQDEFMIDYHIPTLLLFHHRAQFYNHEAYRNGSIILQDKASCLPVHLLNPESGSVILDMCAAPGMKTTQVAAAIHNNGKIYAVEMDEKRHTILNKMVESAKASCIESLNKDVLTLTNSDCPNVEYIIVDPSCSGSGITDRIGVEKIDDNSRLAKLASFQIKMLRHALTKFPKTKRVVYSTCSLYTAENEDVVRQVLETCTTFKLLDAKTLLKREWASCGSSEFGKLGGYCLYAYPESDLTNGFFVAVFERLQDGEVNPFLNSQLYRLHRKEQGRTRRGEDVENYTLNEESSSNMEKPKKIMKEKTTHNIDFETLQELEHQNVSSTDNLKYKKVKKGKLDRGDEMEIVRDDTFSTDIKAKAEFSHFDNAYTKHCVEVDSEKKRSLKKKHKEKVLLEEYVETVKEEKCLESITEDIKCEEPIKKREKHRESVQEKNSRINFNEDDLVCNSKKQKKRKRSETDNTDNADQTLQDPNAEGDVSFISKKNKLDEPCNQESLACSENSNETKRKTKKGKSVSREENSKNDLTYDRKVIESVNIDLDHDKSYESFTDKFEGKKLKKKMEHSGETESDVKKLKKRKKKKHSGETELLDVEVSSTEVSLEKGKHSYKKKQKDNSITTQGECLESVSEDTTCKESIKKRKKKHNSVQEAVCSIHVGKGDPAFENLKKKKRKKSEI